MKVLGVDPGYDRLGVAILEHDGARERLLYSHCIETDRSQDIPERLTALGAELVTLLKNHQPDCVGVETLFFNKNQKTAVAVAEARGVVLYLAKQFGCTVYEFGPQEIKIAVTGYGKSDKQAVYEMVRRLVSDVPEKALDDEYDAIAVGITTLAHTPRS